MAPARWGNQTIRAPKQWVAAYPDAHYEVINQLNYLKFVTGNNL